MDDVRFAFRQMKRAPGFTLVAALTLATLVGVVPANVQILGQSSLWAMRPNTNLPPRAPRTPCRLSGA